MLQIGTFSQAYTKLSQRMIKVLHIHGDHKFISDSGKFDGDIFENHLIILDHKHEFNKKYHDSAHFIDVSHGNFGEVLKKANDADVLVVYELDNVKCRIVNQVVSNVKIIWRFFGWELYSRNLHLYLGPETSKFFKPAIRKNRLYHKFPFLNEKEKAFRKAVKRIDIIAGIFEEEYDELKKYWPELPPFIQLPLQNTEQIDCIDYHQEKWMKKNEIVVGNSRANSNNHLEILDIIDKSEASTDIKIKFLFNYGLENEYSAHVRRRARKMSNVELIESFIPYDEFQSFYYQIGAMVNNSYRQLALGNIFQSMRTGVKIYLNRKSPTYTWLESLGFKIYPVENLENDLQNGDLILSKADANYNLECYKSMLKSYPIVEFQEKVKRMIS